MSKIKVGDLVWHPCSLDIIEHKVVGVHQYDGYSQITTKATHSVGSCGRIECVLDVRRSSIVFVELVDEDFIEHSSGLQDFVKGDYFTSKNEARKAFYKLQSTLAWSNMDQKERLYKEAVKRYEQVQLILKQCEDHVEA